MQENFLTGLLVSIGFEILHRPSGLLIGYMCKILRNFAPNNRENLILQGMIEIRVKP